MNISLLTIAIIVSILWLAIYGFYLYTSQQQERLEDEIERIERKLNADSHEAQER